MKAVTLLVLIGWLLGVALARCDKVIHGTSHSSILLPTPFHQSPIEVIWKHIPSEDELQIAKIQNGSITDRLNDRYTLDANGRDLWIYNVTESDAGEYIAEATMAGGGTLVNYTVCLIVHDPVPSPKIIYKVRRIEGQCYVTLSCSVPSKTANFSLTGKYRQGNSEYQNISSDGNKIEKTLLLYDQDVEFICTVENLADQKIDSVHIKAHSDVEKEKTRSHIPLIGSFVMVAVVFVAILWKSAKKKGQGEDVNETLTSPVQDSGEAGNETLRYPVQDSESEYISISLEKLKD
ncbi:uncharacterized protein ACNLHF_003179 [Anomaloglossus baeobatrachus]|uniref:uncharacterized protein LOC142258634 n=1 Tax=Anomaloglossus baeobatrachus TaxID=238106 RepID=UPI003F5012BD